MPSLADASRGRGLIRSGQSGESVRQLQAELRARGYDIQADGKFGPETEAAVRRFQADTGARVDGLVGPQTMGKLRRSDDVSHGARDITDGTDVEPSPGKVVRRAPTDADRRTAPPPGGARAGDLARDDELRRRGVSGGALPATLAPQGATEAERYDHYARIVRANGGQVCPNGQATVLGIRGVSLDGSAHGTTSSRRYDDTFVVLTPDGRVRELRGATHPGQNRSTMSPDADGDGVGDVGMIRPGNYQVVPNGPHAGNASYHVRTSGGSGNVPGWRDTNHDGSFSDAEREASERRGDTLSGVLFHQGNPSSPVSIGCQTLDPASYRRFIEAVGGPNAAFSYTLVGANR